jgi:peptide deformylase
MNFDLNNRSALTTESSPWDFDVDTGAEQLEQNMIEMMNQHHGIGLAANQIGIAKRVFVIGSDHPDFPDPFGVFNPRIISISDETTLGEEGCLSFPAVWLKVKRPETIEVEYQDSQGIKHYKSFSGYIARCFLHEYDHLNGVCFIDRVSPLKLQLAMKKMRKILNDRTK